MKLYVLFFTCLLFVSSVLSTPLLGSLLLRRRLCRGDRTYIRNNYRSEAAPAAAAPAPASAPAVNVNVQNVYTNKKTDVANNDNRIGAINNHAVKNDVRNNQQINNREENNIYNRNDVRNTAVANNYGGYSQPAYQQQEGECSEGC